jgi:hypothetical protein
MGDDYKFTAIIRLYNTSQKTKSKICDKLIKLGFNIIYVSSNNNYINITVGCLKSIFEKVFKTQLQKIPINGGVGCQAITPIQIPKNLKKEVVDVIIPSLSIYAPPTST